ncbi:unnamed protein product [Anisakis simplex]|uniref:Uncharacterized protein n=1 Tax=Anisakis simplex TaxID=6269 RepID=A0A0M3K7M3_ANISI|nr:unnamed protein product [Anisakis simplex]
MWSFIHAVVLNLKGNSEDEDDIDEKRQSEQPHRESPPYYGLMPKNISSERNSTSNAISYGLKRKVERQCEMKFFLKLVGNIGIVDCEIMILLSALDVPLGEWNQEGSLRSKSDSLSYLGQSPSARYETKMRSSKEKRHIERVALMAEGGVEKLSKKDLNNNDNDQNLNISSPNTYDTFNW